MFKCANFWNIIVPLMFHWRFVEGTLISMETLKVINDYKAKYFNQNIDVLLMILVSLTFGSQVWVTMVVKKIWSRAPKYEKVKWMKLLYALKLSQLLQNKNLNQETKSLHCQVLCSLSWLWYGHWHSQGYHMQMETQSPIITRNKKFKKKILAQNDPLDAYTSVLTNTCHYFFAQSLKQLRITNLFRPERSSVHKHKEISFEKSSNFFLSKIKSLLFLLSNQIFYRYFCSILLEMQRLEELICLLRIQSKKL